MYKVYCIKYKVYMGARACENNHKVCGCADCILYTVCCIKYIVGGGLCTVDCIHGQV